MGAARHVEKRSVLQEDTDDNIGYGKYRQGSLSLGVKLGISRFEV